MHQRLLAWLAAGSIFLTGTLHASIAIPVSLDERIASAKAIFRGTVVDQTCFRDANNGRIYTRTILQVDEALKGQFPEILQLVHRGGVFEGTGEVNDFSPKFSIGEARLIFLDRQQDGKLFAADGASSAVLLHPNDAQLRQQDEILLNQIRGKIPQPNASGIDTTDQAVKSWTPGASVVGDLIDNGSGISSRFILPDRGEKIPYIVDAQALPAGITLSQALGAVSNALSAWSQVSSAKFVFEGLQNFGTDAASVPATDGKIRIQLHDLYNSITSPNVLGHGGRSYSIPGAFPNGGMGGNVNGREFFKNNAGFLTLKHTAPSMQNLATFEEVLCHELGHVLSLDHSSETSGESNFTLKDAVMYYTVHADGRGARLGSYDGPKIQLVHPLNTPPYGFDRVFEVVTAPSTPNVPGINEIQLKGYDLQGSPIAVQITNQTILNGSFALVGSSLKYTPAGYYGDTSRLDPSGGSYYDVAYARFSDGTNASPYISVRVIKLYQDSKPGAGSDGLPDSWMVQYFGNADPNVGFKHKASDDFDGDGVSNLDEFLAGTDPTNANSVLKFTSYNGTNFQFLARPYDLYELQATTDFSVWNLAGTPFVPTVTNASYTNLNTSEAHVFFRLVRVP